MMRTNSLRKNKRTEVFQSVLLAIIFGDAMGQVVETMSREEIKTATNGKGITFFTKPLQTVIQENRSLAAGMYTDDWQLTRLMAESLIAKGSYHQEDIAARHVTAMKETQSGWGGTTKQAVREIEKGFNSSFREGRHFNTPAPSYGEGKGAGNGVAMKLAPLVLWHWAHQTTVQELANDIRDLSHLTHSHPDAYYASVVYAIALRGILEGTTTQPYEFLSYILEGVSRIVPPKSYPREKLLTTQVLRKMVELAQTDAAIFQDTYEIVKPNFNAAESICYAMGNFLGYGNDTKATILHAVNDGGDADSTAALSGALAAAQNGLDSLPMSWYAFWPDLYSEALEVGAALAASCGIQD